MAEKAVEKTARELHNEKANEALTQTVKAITNRRWLAVRAALDLSISEIQAEQEILLVVAANERHREVNGNDSWEKFLEMTESETMEFLGFDISDDVEAADKSVSAAA
jgi:hypothetical protein